MWPSASDRASDRFDRHLVGGAVSSIEAKLADLETRKGSQIAVLIVPTTQPEEIEQYGIRVEDAWKLGRKGVDDGAYLIVAKNDRRVRIEVGYGLEGVLPDAIANRIITETITPHFKLGDYDGGIQAGVDQMISVVNGEPLPAPDRKWERHSNLGNTLPLLLVVVFVASGVLRAMFGRLFGSVATGGLAGGIAWLLSHVLPIGLGAGVMAFVFAMLLGSTRGWSSGGLGGGFGGGLGGGFGGRGGFGAVAASVAAGAVVVVAARREAGSAGRETNPACGGGALAHAPVVSEQHARRHRTGDRGRRAHARRGNPFRRRNRADAAAHSERHGAARARAGGIRVAAGVGYGTQQWVLIYVQMADRSVEIVADRGFRTASARLTGGRCAASWKSISAPDGLKSGDCRRRCHRQFAACHFPPGPKPPEQTANQLPDRPILL